MLIRTPYFEQPSIIAALVCSLIVVGLLKGIIGVGMPVVALPLLSLFIDMSRRTMARTGLRMMPTFPSSP
jgi:uncharacterized membrane protein YfcA